MFLTKWNPTILGDPQVPMFLVHFLPAGCPNRPLKFLGTVKFGNDHMEKIMGYGDYQIGNVTISRASKTKSWLWHRRLSHLNFGAINHLARQGLVKGLSKLKFEKDHLYSACAMGKSTRKTHKPKSEDTNQEKLYLLHMDLCGPMRVESVNGKNENLGKLQPKADIRIFIGYAPTKKAFRIYNRRTRRIVETIHVDFDELTAMASEQCSSGPALNEMTPGTIIPEAIAPIVEVIPPVNIDLIGSPSSTTVEQDTPSTSNSTTPTETQSLIISQDVGDDNLDIEVAHMRSDLLFGIPIPEVNSKQSTTPAYPQAIVQTDHPLPHHNSKWTKDHPLN
nr:integrase, catalytic region, zinc finger, CCHC-type, peptidase aspartic, catalytic [Tanacetum cinerariifolium]